MNHLAAWQIRSVLSGMALCAAGVSLSFYWAIPAHGAPKSKKEIKVTLFGQPCTLQGPVNENALKAVHAISPEQVMPAQSAEQIKKTLEKVKQAKAVPELLEGYRDRLMKRLEGIIAFQEGLAGARKSGTIDALFNSTRPLASNPALHVDFEKRVRALAGNEKPAQWSSAKIDQIGGLFRGTLEANPEEDFHRAIRKLDIQYSCTFEEPSHEDEIEE